MQNKKLNSFKSNQHFLGSAIGDLKLVKDYISSGYDLNVQDMNRKTPLMIGKKLTLIL